MWEFAPSEADINLRSPDELLYESDYPAGNFQILRGAPGLRLGYAVTGNQDLIKAINTRKNPWTINSLAEIAGRLMFPDEEYIRPYQGADQLGAESDVSGIVGMGFSEGLPAHGKFHAGSDPEARCEFTGSLLIIVSGRA